MPKTETINQILNNKVIVIMRGYTLDEGLRAVEAMVAGGISLVEVTFDQTGIAPLSVTTDMISAIAERFDGTHGYPRVCVGAGTVMTAEQVSLAAAAGARYIISPDVNRYVIEETNETSLVSIPGALSPTEAANAYRWGADFVKIFPAGLMGPAYIKAVSAPLSHIRFLAVGSVRENNMAELLNAGALGVGIGAASIASKVMLAEGNYSEITRRAARYVEIAKKY